MKAKHSGKELTILISEEDYSKLQKINERLSKSLFEYLTIEREEIDTELGLHYDVEAIHAELRKQIYHIKNDLAYNEAYEEMVSIENSTIVFGNEQLFLKFATAYNILDDEALGVRVLTNILRVQLIEWMIKHDYKEDNFKKTSYKIASNQIYTGKDVLTPSTIFTQKGKQFFDFLMDGINREHKINRKLLSNLYGYMSAKKMLKGNQFKFAFYWNENFAKPRLKINPKSAGLDAMNWNHPTTKTIEELGRAFEIKFSSK